MKTVKRMSTSTNRFTQCRVYVVDEQGFIEDDNGHPFIPSKINRRWKWNISDNTKNFTKEDIKMLTIKDTTLINNRPMQDISSNDLLDLITEEENRVLALTTILAPSKAIDKLKERHANNISKLVAILDTRDTTSFD